MRKYWWTVWIKVAILAVVLILAYNFVSNQIEEMFSPYLIEETTEESSAVELEEPTEEETDENLVMSILGKIEDAFGVKIDFENLIFDYANEYAQAMKEQSEEERNPILEPLD